MKRFIDELGEPYSYYYILYSGDSVAVKCPKCDKQAEITERHYDGLKVREVRCSSCFHRASEENLSYRYKASGVCTACERWFNLEIRDEQQLAHKQTHINCPHCGRNNQVPLRQIPAYRGRQSLAINGTDPVFGLPFYYCCSYRGKPIWALNRKHLNFMIDYISAELREKPSTTIHRTASYRLPKFIKTAKNRDGVLKALRSLQSLQAN
ncbi:hypothetical protein EBB07_26340 [Paenibacillaceae bacterium]|nr:hypothetical protein EBB07_26340 [Paenibacillaceae bacterium]